MHRMKFEELAPLIKLFFGRSKSPREATRKKFLSEYQISKETAARLLSSDKWRELRDEWLRERIGRALDEASEAAAYREKFSVRMVLRHLQGSGVEHRTFMRLAGEEWRSRRMPLPTLQEKILACIKDTVASRIPLEEMTAKLICETVGVKYKLGSHPWFWKAFVAGRLELQEYHTSSQKTLPPEGVNALSLPGGRWVDLDEEVWDLRPQVPVCFSRSLLRNDIAEIAWPLLKNDLIEGRLAYSTIKGHFLYYRWAGELLGSVVPDVREATLRDVQRAWLQADPQPTKLLGARYALKRIFTHLCGTEAGVAGAKIKELLHIAGWLYTAATVRVDSRDQSFLSSEEMGAVIAGCLTDIKAGLDYADTQPDLLSSSPRVNAAAASTLLDNWATALMILLMLFVGLRRQSVVSLKIGDWSEIRPGLFALLWFHGKKRECKVAILATSVALLIDQYVQRTAAVRQSLGIEEVFLTRGRTGCWQAQPCNHLEYKFEAFIKRHKLNIAETPLRLNCLILRRTYVTRELYLGRSIWALRLQLGHEHLQTTRTYAKFDMFEHPAEVGKALDDYGRQSLTLWRNPLMLMDLEPAECERLLGLKEERHQDVGLCRFDRCHKALTGNPPPCSLCEHLATGPEFAEAWEAEREAREKEIERLGLTPEAGHLLTEKKYQYEMFRANFDYVIGEAGQ